MSISAKHIIIFLQVLLTVIVTSCHRTEPTGPPQIKWSSSDPLSIPLRSRIQKYEKGNLLLNYSFEEGKIYSIDSLRAGYKIDGWQKTGSNVEWVNVLYDSIYGPNEAYSGNRSIKIKRFHANETDEQGEGIISDFVRVIPGKYQFTFYIKLEDIESSKLRLGTKLYDAIDIQLYFYDKNMISIPGDQYVPVYDKIVNSSFQGFGFSNFWSIKKLNWTRVTGKAHNNIMCSGDIPDEARYVKVFLGLKGTGTMWVDNVEFRYSQTNFSVAEQMNNMLDSSYSNHEMLIPTPKKIDKLESITYYLNGKNITTLPIVLLPEHADQVTVAAGELLVKKIKELYISLYDSADPYINYKPVTKINPSEVRSAPLILSIGKNEFYAKYKSILPLREIEDIPQSYFIYTISDLPNIVFLAGDEPEGNFYAASTAIQLFDNKNFIFHNARIIDYPDYLSRNFLFDLKLLETQPKFAAEAADILVKAKFNGAYLTYGNDIENHLSTSLSFLDLKNRIKYPSYFTFNLMISHPDFVYSPENNITVSCKLSDISYGDLLNSSRIAFNKGIKDIAFSSYTIFNPYYTNYKDIKDFLPGDLKISSYSFMQFSKNFGQYFPGHYLEFLPVWFNNELIDFGSGNGELYLKRLTENQNGYSLFFTGNSAFCDHLDLMDISRFKSITGLSPLFWDNSLLVAKTNEKIFRKQNLYPGKIKTGNLMAPYQNSQLPEILNEIKYRKVFLNYSPGNEMDVIRMLTAAEFYWNMNSYNPVEALNKILTRRYGVMIGQDIINFIDKYQFVLSQLPGFSADGTLQRFTRKYKAELSAMELIIQNIKIALGEKDQLVIDLTNVYSELQNEILNLDGDHLP